MKRKSSTTPKQLLERIFRITRRNNEIDLTGSVAIINGKASEANFENEVYQVTFSAGKKDKKKAHNVFMTASESISKEDIQALKNNLGIEISGDGSLFRVESFQKDFKIAFDLHNSISVDTLGVKKGVIVFRKDNTQRRDLKIPYRKRKSQRLKNPIT